jgi:outer membrane lipoprotein-sorting protein
MAGTGRGRRRFLMALLVGSFAIVRAAENPRQIVEEAQKRTDAKTQRYEGLLQTFDGNGKTTEKRWVQDRIGAHGQSKAVIRFTAPAEVKGVALLIVNHPDRSSDQWMWTPAIERDRRIALQDRSTRFFGTDFSFEDLEERDVDQYDYSALGEEVIDGADCWKIQSIPKQSKSSQYTKAILWIRKDNYAFARVESYVKDQVVRRLNYSRINNIQGIWTARELTLTDLKRGSLTRLTLEKVEYNLPLKEDNFTLQAIRRQ